MKSTFLATLMVSATALTFGAEHDQSINVQFPDAVGKLHLKTRVDFPQKALGVNYPYERPQGLVRGSVYIYTGGLSTIPSSIESPVVQKHFDQIIREVKSLEALGQVKTVVLSSEHTQTTTYPGCGPQFLWRSYMMDLGGTRPLKAYTYLTAINNHFVKLRVTLNEETQQEQRDAEEFVAEIRKVLGRCQ